MKYAFHPEARLEYREAAAFYEARQPGLGAAFTREIESVIDLIVIISFRCHETQKIFHGDFSRHLAHDMQVTARRKLRMLHQTETLQDLMAPPNNRLEALKGNRKGQYSIRISGQWRICLG